MQIGYKEIAERLGVATVTVRQWKTRGLLPDPATPTTTARTPVLWEEEQIMAWARQTGRDCPEYRESVARWHRGGNIEYRVGSETGFEREMRLAREAARK